MARVLLQNELKDLCTYPIDGFSAWEVDENNIFQWNVTFYGFKDTPFEGDVFRAIMSFPQNYPHSPPTVRFLSEIRHPDVRPDGEVSGSIFLPAANGRKLAGGRLSPAHTVENIVLSVLSMLSSPIDESAAKVEAVVIRDLLPPSENSACSNEDEHCFEHESSGEQFRCDGCKQQGSGPRYRCVDRNYVLHKECRFPSPTAFPDFLGDLEFRFFDKPQDQGAGRCCDACRRNVLGFNYQSIDGKWVLHPCCSKLLKKMPIEETLFELREKISSRCNWCQKKKISGGSVSGWGYASRCGDYHFHVHCLMEMLHTNASIKDGNLGLERINLRHVAQKLKKKGKRGWRIFSTIVKIFLQTVLSILLGDPTVLLATAVVEPLLQGLA